jgi:glucan endo-1,3-alpha-glucosidase
MGVSPLQFKHIDSGDNWYRRGEENLEYRFGQVLSMQPDFIELQTWNDAGESHYMGNSWPEPIAGTAIVGYTQNYDHTGYWQILPAFIKAYKSGATTTSTMYPTNGAIAQGTFWHHTLLAAGVSSSYSDSCVYKLNSHPDLPIRHSRTAAGSLHGRGQSHGMRSYIVYFSKMPIK